jgi:signal transduction histidine kinase
LAYQGDLAIRLRYVVIGIFAVCALAQTFVSVHDFFSNGTRPVSIPERIAEALESLPSHVSHRTIDFDSVASIGTTSDRENLRPRESFFFTVPLDIIRQSATSGKSCQGPMLDGSMNLRGGDLPAVQKMIAWTQIMCGVETDFDQFLRNAPYVHPSGVSYAKLLSERIDDLKLPISENVRKYMLVSEKANRSKDEDLFSKLSPDGRRSLLSHQSIIVDGQHVLLADKDKRSVPNYHVFAKSEVEQYLTESFRVSFLPPTEASQCDAFQMGLCWNDGARDAGQNLASQIGPTGLALLVTSAGLVLISCLGWIAALARRQRKIEGDQALIFRIISHEIRTPLTSLGLNIDRFRGLYDELPESARNCLGGLLDAYRELNQVIAKSLNEFKSTGRGRSIAPADLVSRLVDKRYRGLVALDVSAESSRVIVSPFWFTICVQNLINNALAHGKPPVVITVKSEGRNTIIQVADAGTVRWKPRSRFEVQSKPSPSEDSLGIGLAIVRRKAEEMSADLRVFTNPTRVQLVFRTETNGENSPSDS